jgi:hypothetical protein
VSVTRHNVTDCNIYPMCARKKFFFS